jgi:hypothetical protein
MKTVKQLKQIVSEEDCSWLFILAYYLRAITFTVRITQGIPTWYSHVQKYHPFTWIVIIGLFLLESGYRIATEVRNLFVEYRTSDFFAPSQEEPVL